MKWGPEHAQKHDLSSLRLLGSVGEPINPEAWIWYHEHIGGDRCADRRHVVADRDGDDHDHAAPGVTTTKPGSATRPFPGVDAAVYDERATRSGPGGGGYLVLRRPWPAMLRGIYKDHDRYRRDVLDALSRASTSRATARGSTRTATSGCSAASTT